MKGLNLKHLLHDPTGRQPGPLIVRQARMMKPVSSSRQPAPIQNGISYDQVLLSDQMRLLCQLNNLRGSQEELQALQLFTAANQTGVQRPSLVGWPAPGSMHTNLGLESCDVMQGPADIASLPPRPLAVSGVYPGAGAASASAVPHRDGIGAARPRRSVSEMFGAAEPSSTMYRPVPTQQVAV